MSAFPKKVKIVEVGPRDGLQNEATAVPTEVKVEFIEALARSGLRHIEAGSFVNPKLVPQLADSEQVLSLLKSNSGVTYSALVPNVKGLARAAGAGVKRVAVFTAASESFTKKNIGMSIAESLNVFREVVSEAKRLGMTARGYVSTAFHCPFEGRIEGDAALRVASSLLEIGVDEVAVSDTIGAAVPTDVAATMERVLKAIPANRIALHFHDTNGFALANVYAGLTLGISTFDSSAGGLGGCPFAPGAAGNLATEDVVHFLRQMGIETGVDVDKVLVAAGIIAKHLNRPMHSAQWRRRCVSKS